MRTPNSTLVVIRPESLSIGYQSDFDSLMEKLIERKTK